MPKEYVFSPIFFSNEKTSSLSVVNSPSIEKQNKEVKSCKLDSSSKLICLNSSYSSLLKTLSLF